MIEQTTQMEISIETIFEQKNKNNTNGKRFFSTNDWKRYFPINDLTKNKNNTNGNQTT